MTLIFPNKYLATNSDSLIKPDTALSIPGPGYGFTGFKAVAPLGKGRLIALVAPISVSATVFTQVEAQRSKGFQPVRAPGPYLEQLVDQIRTVLAGSNERETAVEMWGFAIVDYQIDA